MPPTTLNSEEPFISTAQPPDNTARAAQDLSIFKENTSSSINLQVRGYFRKRVTNQTHIFPTPPARLPQATNTPKIDYRNPP